MPVVPIALPHHRYQITIAPGAIADLGRLVRSLAPHDRAALIADQHVAQLYGAPAASSLHAAGYQLTTATTQPGEDRKTLDTVRELYDTLLTARLERRSPIVALGGGVLGDTVGFVASTYLRGVPLVQVPTTLLAMVDSSVGGKVGVNVAQGKNLIGAFYHPLAVLIDPLVLQTLPPRELRCGLAECIKHAVIRDPQLFDWIADRVPHIQSLDPDTLGELIARNVRIKAAVVIADERESGERAHLNFGHTFAHAIEATAGYGLFHHGEAVALGMVAAAHLAVDLQMCDTATLTRLTRLLTAVGLPIAADLPDTDTLLAAMRLDKKVADSRLRFVLPTRLGEVVIRADVPAEAVAAAWSTIRRG